VFHEKLPERKNPKNKKESYFMLSYRAFCQTADRTQRCLHKHCVYKSANIVLITLYTGRTQKQRHLFVEGSAKLKGLRQNTNINYHSQRSCLGV
jgi:hypothetical protein